MGIVIRDHLLVLLRRAVGLGTTASLNVPYVELNRQFVSKQALMMVHQQSAAVLGDTRMEGFPGLTGRLLDEVCVCVWGGGGGAEVFLVGEGCFWWVRGVWRACPAWDDWA